MHGPVWSAVYPAYLLLMSAPRVVRLHFCPSVRPVFSGLLLGYVYIHFGNYTQLHVGGTRRNLVLPPALVESFFRGAITAIKDEVGCSTVLLVDACCNVC